MRSPLLLALIVSVAAACTSARAPVAVPNARPPLVRPLSSGTAPSLPGPTGADVAKMLGDSGLYFHTLETDRRWMLAFAGERLAQVVLYVLHGPQFTVVLGRLFEVPPDAGVGFYRALALKNFELDQIKLSIDPGGGVFASFEVPTRILDRRELLENVISLAGVIDRMVPELLEHAAPDGAPPLPPPAPPRDPELERTLEAAVAQGLLPPLR